jgi:xanthine dehydrogenase molybdopterin-binding subunit B
MSEGASECCLGWHRRVTVVLRYIAASNPENMLHVKLVHLDCGHAAIVSIDTARAAAAPGVNCVITAADLPSPMPRFGPVYEDRPILAIGETKYHGEPVAAVAAVRGSLGEGAVVRGRVEF